MAGQAQNRTPQDLKPRAAVRRESPWSQSALEGSGGLRAQGHGVRAGSGPTSPTWQKHRPGARETPAAPGAKPEDKKKAKKHEAAEKGGSSLVLTFLLTPEPKVPQPPLTRRLSSRAPAPPNRKRPLAPPLPPRQRPPDQSTTNPQLTQSFLG